MITLPNELILDILENLSYSDLKQTIPLVSSQFLSLIHKRTPGAAGKIDRILFRDAPRQSSPEPPTAEHFTLNPLFDKLLYKYTASVDRDNLSFKCRNEYKALADSPLRNENATSPALPKVVIHIDLRTHVGPRLKGPGYFEPELEIVGSGERGAVTVMDVMEGVAEVVRRAGSDTNHSSRRNPTWVRFFHAKIIDGVLHLYDDIM